MERYETLQKRLDRNTNNLRQQLKKASGISACHFPHGFDAVISFDFGDIFVDEVVFQRMDSTVRREIDDCLMRFLREDFGNVTEEELEQNGENKYFGDGSRMVARYRISIGLVEVVVNQNTMISLLK